MSVHPIPARNPEDSLIVAFDRRLNIFSAIVFEKSVGFPNDLSDFAGFADIEELKEAIKPYGNLPEEVEEALRSESSGRGPALVGIRTTEPEVDHGRGRR